MEIMSAASVPRPERRGEVRPWVGRCLVNPVIDYAFVGGAITIPIFVAIYFFPSLTPTSGGITLRSFMLINGAHFAASTVRLYTKPGAQKEFPVLCWAFPVVCFGAVGLALWLPAVGRNITALYFTWSPYHYAAQTYGLAVMYAMRSGARLAARDKTQMWWVCLVPFLYSFLTSTQGGLAWFVSPDWLMTMPALAFAHSGLVFFVTLATFLLPVSLFWQLRRMRGKNVPLISLVLQVTNGLWWLGTDYLSAWWWTAMFHSIQYLIVVVERHISEQMARTDVRGSLHRPLVYGSAFYGVSFVLAVILFFVTPLAYVPFGFDAAQAFVMMTVVINLHHFVVDGFIWRARSGTAMPRLQTPDSVPIAV
jgi:hypothetical protein